MTSLALSIIGSAGCYAESRAESIPFLAWELPNSAIAGRERHQIGIGTGTCASPGRSSPPPPSPCVPVHSQCMRGLHPSRVGATLRGAPPRAITAVGVFLFFGAIVAFLAGTTLIWRETLLDHSSQAVGTENPSKTDIEKTSLCRRRLPKR